MERLPMLDDVGDIELGDLTKSRGSLDTDEDSYAHESRAGGFIDRLLQQMLMKIKSISWTINFGFCLSLALFISWLLLALVVSLEEQVKDGGFQSPSTVTDTLAATNSCAIASSAAASYSATAPHGR
jgi:hypothetical protein